jgi:hypothetical protein
VKRCRTCRETKPFEDFQVLRSSRDGRNGRCRECCKDWYRQNAALQKARVRARNNRVQAEMRAYILEHFRSNPCVDCGEGDVRCLEFDHRPGQKKDDAIALLIRNVASWARLQAEIAKCDVRCANCHRRATTERGNHWRQAARDEDVSRARAAASARLARLFGGDLP